MAEPQSEVQYGTLDLMVLKTLDSMGPLHGYGIARRIEQAAQGLLALNQGTIYPALVRLRPKAGSAATGSPAKTTGAHAFTPSLGREKSSWRPKRKAGPGPLPSSTGCWRTGRDLASASIAVLGIVDAAAARCAAERGDSNASRAADRGTARARTVAGRGATGGASRIRRRRIREKNSPEMSEGCRLSNRCCKTPASRCGSSAAIRRSRSRRFSRWRLASAARQRSSASSTLS